MAPLEKWAGSTEDAPLSQPSHSKGIHAVQHQGTTITPTAPTVDEEIRRTILDALRERPTTTEIARTYSGLSYARVSKSVQTTIPQQEESILQLAARLGVPVVRKRKDEGSRWDNTRPDYVRLLQDIDSREFTHLLLFNADRLGGDDQEFVKTVRLALKKGMTVYDTVHGEITDELATMLGLISHWEIKHGHFRVVLGLSGKAKDGIKIGSILPGYKPQCRMHPCKCGLHGKHIIDDTKAPLVRELFDRYAKGEPLGSLLRWWNTTTGDKRNNLALKDLLKNVYYIGIVINGKWYNNKVDGRRRKAQHEWDIGEHPHPLIDPSTFAIVQARLRENENMGQVRQRKATHPLVGLMHCVDCDRRMRYTRSRAAFYCWECPVCTRNRGEKKIEAAILTVLRSLPFPDEVALSGYAAQHTSMERAIKREIAAIDAERDKLEKRIDTWTEQVGDGILDPDVYKRNVAKANAQLAELRKQQTGLEETNANRPGHADLLQEATRALNQVKDWTSTMEGMDGEQIRMLYRALIKGVYLHFEGTLTVVYTDAVATFVGHKSDTVPLVSIQARNRTPVKR